MTPPKKTDYKFTLLLVFNILVFTFLFQSGLIIINKNLSLQGFLARDMDSLEIIQFLFNIVAAFGTIYIIHKFSWQKIMFAALIVIAASMILMNLTVNYYIATCCLSLITGSSFIYLAISLIRIITYNDHKHFVLIAAFLALLLGYLFADDLAIILYNKIDGKLIIFISFTALIFLLVSTFLFKVPSITNTGFKSSFSTLMNNMELQMLSAFIVTYIATSIYWDYETFLITYKSAALTSLSVQRTIALALLAAIIPLSIIMTKFNQYTLTLIFALTVFICCMLMPKLAITSLGSKIVLSIIGISLFTIFISNILILCGKVAGEELQTVLMMYFCMNTIGSYVGIISSDKFIERYNESGFLLSLYFTLGIFLAYYIYQFIKHKLYRML